MGETIIMTKKKIVEEKKVELWRGRWPYPKDFPEEYFGLLNDRYDLIEVWEAKRRKQGPPFNEQFCADVYAIANIMTRDNSFKGKFDPEALYKEMCETMNTIRKGKKDYSFWDETKMFDIVMDNHRKKK